MPSCRTSSSNRTTLAVVPAAPGWDEHGETRTHPRRIRERYGHAAPDDAPVRGRARRNPPAQGGRDGFRTEGRRHHLAAHGRHAGSRREAARGVSLDPDKLAETDADI